MLGAVMVGPGCNRSSPSAAVIAIDGSSTVFPITEAVAEEFQKTHRARVTIGVSGTGGGFKKFCNGETAISGASRPIKPSEVDLCRSKDIEYIELPVAYDGIAIVVHVDNTWVDHMTVAELQALWRPEAQGEVRRWSQVRTGWPDREIHLFGPGVDSGTYDYFTAAIVGKEHSSRGDFTSSEDDNVLVQGIATDPLGLGFFGYAYFAENKTRLKLVPIDDGNAANGPGPIAPSPQTVGNGTYQPLARPIFIYVGKRAAEREEVRSFSDFYIGHASGLVGEVGYIPLPDQTYSLVAQRFEQRVVGSVFAGSGSRVGATVEDLLGGR
jgi:phosphate transport system substrate-binding protein